MRKVFLDNLPKHQHGTNNGKIDWKSSLGLYVEYIYEHKTGRIKIVNYKRNGSMKLIEIENDYGEKKWVNTKTLYQCCIKKFIHYYNYKYAIGAKINNSIVLNQTTKKRCNKNQEDKAYDLKCNTCGYIYTTNEYDIERGNACPCCSSRIIVVGINDIKTTHPWMLEFFYDKKDAENKTYGSNYKIKPKCKCGIAGKHKIKINEIYNRDGWRCENCSRGISYPNRFMNEFLKQLGISFQREYRVETGRKYDFYIPAMRLLIEMDGSFHFMENKFTGESVDKQKEIDKQKNQYAIDNGYTLIRILSSPEKFHVIKKSILESKLSEMFDLKNINWEKCQKHALSSLQSDVCVYYENSKHPPISDVANFFNISNCTVTDYLSKGDLAGICTYDKEESARNGIKKGNNTRKLNTNNIFVFNLKKEFIGVFSSARDLDRKSKDIFGVRLNQSYINKICREKTYFYKNMLFAYSKEEIMRYKIPLKYTSYIECRSLDGELISTYSTAREAERYTGVGHDRILLCCKGKYKQAGGYVWKKVYK